MSTTQTLPALRGVQLLAGLAARLFARLEQAVERLGRQWAREREQRLTEAALRQLDARTLRDIGLTRGEVASAAAEHAGIVEATRARVWREIGSRVC